MSRSTDRPDFDDLSARPGHQRRIGIWIAALAMLAAVSLGTLGLGRYPVSPHEVLLALLGRQDSPALSVLRMVVIEVRLPRLLAAALVGAALSVAGASYQTVFRNPLVSPGLLGVLSGSAFGAALAIVLAAHPLWVQAAAFAGGLTAAAVGLGIAGALRSGNVLALVLGGLISDALFSSLLSLVKYVADPQNQLPAIVYWLLGSLAQVGWDDLDRFAVPLALGTGLLCAGGRLLDALSLSDDEARSLGVPVTALRLAVIALATLISALTVSVAGIIGWIGLLVPHMARLLVGAGHRQLLPLSAVIGAIVLILADTCARSVSAGEVPLGIVTQLFGALGFALVLRRLRQDAS
ncbi:FecCD family ABC transporter permease [Frateuria defendens]|uniref:FecCD family ABC transporter permease n=1 Tax=Frateuria defendens TaxID=2219559 RepID=UPI0009E61AF9|nr:iron ABC transporter permease [Frateuria defendens]